MTETEGGKQEDATDFQGQLATLTCTAKDLQTQEEHAEACTASESKDQIIRKALLLLHSLS